MTGAPYTFRTNVRLKDLLGRGLILNDNVAIIELIKNSNDANSEVVQVCFEGASVPSANARITIQDFGHGMSLDDFRDKWLNIAFSGKRNNTNNGRAYAGEKGVGRFSCDRLGHTLRLISKCDHFPAFEASINWKDFEIDNIDLEISSIPISINVLSDDEYLTATGSTNSGTLLIIGGLRSIWDKDKLESLHRELERFIIDPEKRFKVYLKSDDIFEKSGNLKYNHLIENRLFEKLDEKTTSVYSEIIDAGANIITEIRHDGVRIFSFKVKNNFDHLRDISARVQIHYLNQGAKASFKSITGYMSSEYGSIMMFLNGFRVMPYGEPDNDWLHINRRKAQGTARYLGTRDVFGRVEINDNQRVLVPITSREGVERNAAFEQLSEYDLGNAQRGFIHAAFIALETYVVRGLDWDRVEPRGNAYDQQELINAMLSAIDQIGNRHHLKDIWVDEVVIRKIASQKIDEYDNFLNSLKKEVADKSVYDLTPAEKRKVTKFVDRLDTRVQASKVTAAEYRKEAVVERKRRLFAESQSKPDSRKQDEMVHHMRILSDKMSGELKRASSLLNEVIGTAPQVRDALSFIQSTIFNNKKLSNLSKIISRSDFNMMSDILCEDIFSYVDQYVNELVDKDDSIHLNIKFLNENDLELNLNFSPLEMSMLVDNIIENSEKSRSKNIEIIVTDLGDDLELRFKNDGDHLSNQFDSSHLFLAGITTTSGSGIGLAQVQRIAEALEADVFIENNADSNVGVSIKMVWKK